MMQQQMSMGGGAMDTPSVYKQEKDQLEMMVHTSRVDQFIEAATKAVTI
jgi:hypothetical protein